MNVAKKRVRCPKCDWRGMRARISKPCPKCGYEHPRNLIVDDPSDVLLAYGLPPHAFATLRHMGGGMLAGLVKKFGGLLPDGFLFGKTFKFQRKGIRIFGAIFDYPFDLDKFEKWYQHLLDSRPQHCHSKRGGDCIWPACPQIRDNEPERTGRHCPLDVDGGENYH